MTHYIRWAAKIWLGVVFVTFIGIMLSIIHEQHGWAGIGVGFGILVTLASVIIVVEHIGDTHG